ncbi:hypothetical protein LTR66_005650, partial [Elasticomyces elasticus]
MDALDEKLRNIASEPATEPTSRSSSAETPHPEDLKEDYLRQEKEARDALILDGGRPSHPIDSGFDILEEPGQYADIISYWCRGWSGGASGWGIFCDQFGVWKKFREYQEAVRQSRTGSKDFARYAQKARDYRRKKGLKGDVELHQDRKRQTQSDDWKEYQLYQLQTADRFTSDMKYAERRLEGSQKRLKAAVEKGQSEQSIGLIKEYGIAHWQGRRGTARRQLEKHEVLLKWIDQQLPVIASECSSSDQRPEICHRSDSTEANAVTEAPQVESEAARSLGHQSNPARTSRKRKRSLDESTPHLSIPSKVKRSATTTNVCERREVGTISSASALSDKHADGRDGGHSAAAQQQEHDAQPRRSQRIATLQKEAAALAPGALPPSRLSKVQKASARKDLHA